MTLTTFQTASSQTVSNIIVQKGSSFPITQLTIFTPVGSAALDQKGGECALLQSIITFSSLAAIIENHGGDYVIDCTKDSWSFKIRILTEELASFLPQFKEALTSFQVDPSELDLAKKRLVETIRNIDGNPERKSSLLFQKDIFGSHPYGASRLGTLESIASISITEIANIWDKLSSDKRRIYIVASSDKPTSIRGALISFWQALPEKTSLIPEVPVVNFPTQALTLGHKDPNSSQSFVHIGILMPRVSFEEKPYLLMLADIVGGGFNSRLFTLLRAKHGLSYSPHAYYRSWLLADILDIAYSTKSESTEQSLSIVHNILDSIQKNGVEQKEFETTQKLIYNRLLRLEEDNQGLNQLVVNEILYKNPQDSIKVLKQGVKDCTLEDLNNFVKSLLSQYPRLQVVLEGS